MKRIIYIVLFVSVAIIVPDRLLKLYEMRAAEKEIQKHCSANPFLSPLKERHYQAASTFRLEPYTVFGLKPNFKSATVNINSLGLRGSEIGEKKKDCYRIAVIGNSAVFGGTVSADRLTFCELLEENLKREKGGKIEVINAGVPAYTTMQEVILLEDKIIPLKPDMVIIFEGSSDALTILLKEKRPNYPWWFSDVERVYYSSATKLFIEKNLRKYRPTKFILKWWDRRKTKKTEYVENPEQIIFYRRNLDLMCHLAKSYGIDVVLAFQPILLYKNNLTENEKKIIASLDPGYVKAVKAMWDLSRDAMYEVAVQNDVDFIDGAIFFDDTEENIFVGDEVHFNEPGHRIIADVLAERLLSSSRFKIKTKDEI